jgi:hypothetical protein
VLDSGAAKIQVAQTAGAPNGVVLYRSVPLVAGTTYTLSFQARADKPVPLTTNWRTFELPLTSAGTDPVAQLRFILGGTAGSIWLDNVKLQVGDRNIYRRDFEHGVALVNPTAAPATINLGGTFRKIKGTQDPQVNDGSLVTSVTLPAKDGLILLRQFRLPTSIKICTSRARMSPRKAFVVEGRLTPGQLRDCCIAEVEKPGKVYWTYSSARLTYTTAGDVWYQYVPRVRGTYHFRLRFSGDARRLSCVSSTIRVVVR